MKRKDKKNAPLFYSLKETCRILNIKPYILDYWKKRIPEIKTHKIGKRKFFKKEDLEILFKIKKLLDEGYTIEGIRKKLFFSKEDTKKKERASPSLFPEISPPLPSKTIAKNILNRSDNLQRLLKEVLKELKEIYKLL